MRCETVELKLTLPAKAFGKSVREALLAPFVRAYAKRQTGRRTAPTVDDVVKVEVDGMAISDALLVSSFATGAPLVRVLVYLRHEIDADAPPCTSSSTSAAEVEDEDDEPEPPVSVHADLNKYYSKWSTFDDKAYE